MSLLRIVLLPLLMLVYSSSYAMDMVDINHADVKALSENLKGVGKVKAQAIVDYRNEHGSFKSVDDLMQVKGISKKIIKANRDRISLGGMMNPCAMKMNPCAMPHNPCAMKMNPCAM